MYGTCLVFFKNETIAGCPNTGKPETVRLDGLMGRSGLKHTQTISP